MDETERLLNNGTIQSFITHRFILWGREGKKERVVVRVCKTCGIVHNIKVTCPWCECKENQLKNLNCQKSEKASK